jgi:hypothetical protein
MKHSIGLAILAVSLCGAASAQEPAATPPSTPSSGSTPSQRQKNAASATKDTSGTSGDQITTPPGAKGSVLIGCLAGPDKDGKFMVRNMTHRLGVQVLGSDELKNDAGSKVKLTGQWQPIPDLPKDKKPAETHRFQATDVEVVAPNCKPPSETTPVSKNKPQKATTYNAPSSDSSK